MFLFKLYIKYDVAKKHKTVVYPLSHLCVFFWLNLYLFKISVPTKKKKNQKPSYIFYIVIFVKAFER